VSDLALALLPVVAFTLWVAYHVVRNGRAP